MIEHSTKQRILEEAREKFFNYGFSKVTTDEIVADLGISKKTLYKYFPQKQQLLNEVVDLTLVEIKSGAENIIYDESLEFVKKLESLLAWISSNLSRLKKPFLNDLQKTAPEIWQTIRAFRKEMIHTIFANIVKEGMQKGMFRRDVDSEIVVLIIFSTIDAIINPETLSHLPVTAQEAFRSIIKVLFEGLLLDAAKKKF